MKGLRQRSDALLDLPAPAVKLCILAAGVFFSSGLLTGAWKYWHIARSANATSPVYVDIAHRTSLLYSFAAILLAHFAALSVWSAQTNFIAAAIPLGLFAAAIGGYILHGSLRDTDDQFLKPHKIAAISLPSWGPGPIIWLLMAGDMGGLAVGFGVVMMGSEL